MCRLYASELVLVNSSQQFFPTETANIKKDATSSIEAERYETAIAHITTDLCQETFAETLKCGHNLAACIFQRTAIINDFINQSQLRSKWRL